MEMVGRRISHYTVLRHLGSGGMGDVYLAQDTRLDRSVALKLLPPDLAHDPERLRRFEQEARAASALDHPAVAHVYEIGADAGAPFIAMQYVDGQTLGVRIGEQPLPTREILRVAIEVADALDEAHARGIVHRDIKPSNIMLDSRGRVKVVDFGLAKQHPGLPVDTRAPTGGRTGTEAGLVLGTVRYLSPEQARGRAADGRSDIFSLGVVLYEMITGRLPFSGANAVEMILSILESEPLPPARFNYELSPELERIVRKCLEKDPDRRYQSARELCVDLRNLERDLAAGRLRDAARPPARRRRRLAAAAAILLGGAALGVVAWLWPGRQGRQSVGSIAILPFVRSAGSADLEYLSDGITEGVIDAIARLPQVRVMARSTVFRYKDKLVDPRAVGRELNVAAVLTGSLARRGDTILVRAELVDAADGSRLWGDELERELRDVAGVQQQIAQELSEQLRLRLTSAQQQRLARRDTENSEAYQLYLRGRYHWNKRSEEGFQKAVESFTRAIEKDPGYALAYAGLADTYTLMPAWGFLTPKEGHERAREAATRALALDEGLAEAHAALAHTLHNYDWDWAGAEREYRRAIELKPGYATAHHWWADCLSEMGRTEEALAEKRRALDLDPLSPVIQTELGTVLYQARRYDQALDQLRRTLDLDPLFPLAHDALGHVYEAKGLYPEAIAALETAHRLSPEDLEFEADLGQAYALAGRRAEARAILARIEQAAKGRYVVAFDRAMVLLGLGETEAALDWLERAFEERSYQVSSLMVAPRLDALRGQPRFEALLARLNVPGGRRPGR